MLMLMLMLMLRNRAVVTHFLSHLLKYYPRPKGQYRSERIHYHSNSFLEAVFENIRPLTILQAAGTVTSWT